MKERQRLLGLAGILALAVGVEALGQPTSDLARSIAWLLGAAAAIGVGARRRSEPPASWQVIGIGHVLVGGAWGARAVEPSIGALGAWPDLPAGVGLIVTGAGLLLAGRGRRERVALLDGAILAGAVLTFAWAALVAPNIVAATTRGQILGAAVHVAGATLVVSVAIAIALSGRTRFSNTTSASAMAVGAMLLGGVGWAWRGLSGDTQSVVGGAAWMVAPLLVAVIAMSAPSLVEERAAPIGPMTVARFGLLILLTLMPSLTVGILSIDGGALATDVPVELGMWVTSVSVLLLAARIRLTGDFAVEDERQATTIRHQRLIEHSADVIALVSREGRVFYTSPSMSRVLGRNPDDVDQTPFAALIAGDDRVELKSAMEEAARHRGTPVSLHVRLVAGDGQLRPAEGTVNDLTDVAGVAGFVVTLRDVSARVKLEQELRRAALEDPLTGLANRTLLVDRARHALVQRGAAAGRVGFLYLDVDDFKTVNDGLGHQAGDQVLQVIADRLRAVVRDGDTPGRLGGDEFAILLEQLDPDDPVGAATNVAQRLLGRMQEPIVVAGQGVRMRVSIGLAVGSEGIDVQELIQNADVAMYAAKKAGTDYALYDEGMETRARRRLVLTRDLEVGLSNGEVRLGYQPIVSLVDRQMVSVEALLRWDHPRLGAIPASEMEDLAIRGGLADELTRFVFETVSDDKQRWVEQFGTPLVVAVNLAALQLSEAVVPMFEQFFTDRTPGPPGIQVELTESALLRDARTAAAILGELRSRGATIAIDDFGTGYASLSYLRRLPVDALKIDREFIAELVPGESAGSFAALIRDLARRLDLVTVAEGIETKEQYAAAIALGCERGQGYLFGRAVPIKDLALDHAMRGQGAIAIG